MASQKELRTYEITLRLRKGESDQIVTTKGYSLIVNQRGDLLVCDKAANIYELQSHRVLGCYRSGVWIHAKQLELSTKEDQSE